MATIIIAAAPLVFAGAAARVREDMAVMRQVQQYHEDRLKKLEALNERMAQVLLEDRLRRDASR